MRAIAPAIMGDVAVGVIAAANLTVVNVAGVEWCAPTPEAVHTSAGHIDPHIIVVTLSISSIRRCSPARLGS